MLLAMNGIISPKEYEHDSTLCNNDGCTVAIILAKNKKIPPK